MIEVEVRPTTLIHNQPTDVTVSVVNRSAARWCYSVVVEIEPDLAIRFDQGDPLIQVDALGPGTTYTRRLTLTGRTVGIGRIHLPNFSYSDDRDDAVRPHVAPLAFHISAPPPPTPRTGSSGVPTPGPTPLPSAFISHRRADGVWFVTRLVETLTTRLRGSRIVLDLDLIRPGEPWLSAVDREMHRAAALLALVGPHWETGSRSDRELRIGLSDDVVRREIRTALAREILIIPVLFDRPELPDRSVLPADVRPLLGLQAVHVERATEVADIRRIVRRLRSVGFE
jgi:hypothetical protein